MAPEPPETPFLGVLRPYRPPEIDFWPFYIEKTQILPIFGIFGSPKPQNPRFLTPIGPQKCKNLNFWGQIATNLVQNRDFLAQTTHHLA